MGKFIDLSGVRFERLVVTRRANIKSLKPKWEYLCDCGNTGIANASDLRSGHHRSCGCLHRDCMTSHGLSRSPTYKIWTFMVQRCTNPRATGFCYYGGRGITVCARWQSFEAFVADMGEQPGPRWSIDRIDVNGNYEPSNCRWLTMQAQQLNRRNNRRVTLEGRTQTVKEWCDELGINEELFRGRLKIGWTPDRIVSTPAMPARGRERNLTTGRWRSA